MDEADNVGRYNSPENIAVEVIESLPADVRDNALVDWRTFADIFARKDVEAARDWAKSLGIKLVRTGRRELPTWKEVRELQKRLEFTPTV